MSETERIADELERMTSGEAWHGPAIMQALEGVTAGDAAARPIPGAHSIWEIVHHLTAWATEVERRLRENARPLNAEADWPPVARAGAATWEEAKQALSDARARLRQSVREFPPSRLQQEIDVERCSYYVMLHGLAQHDAYHTGQIAMLKKALRHATAAAVG